MARSPFFLVVRPEATSSVRSLLVAMPFVPSSDARSYKLINISSSIPHVLFSSWEGEQKQNRSVKGTGGKPGSSPWWKTSSNTTCNSCFAAGPPCLLNKPIGQGPIHSLDGPRLRSSFHEMSVAHHRLSYDQDDEEAEESVEDEEEHEEQEEQDRMHGERLLNWETFLWTRREGTYKRWPPTY